MKDYFTFGHVIIQDCTLTCGNTDVGVLEIMCTFYVGLGTVAIGTVQVLFCETRQKLTKFQYEEKIL